MAKEERRKIVVSRHIGDDAMGLLQTQFQHDKQWDLVVWSEDSACTRSWLLENVQGADAILVTLVEKINEELLIAAGPKLRLVSTMSVGYDHIDTQALFKRGIKLGYTPDVLTDAVADITLMLALMASRNASEALSIVKAGQWSSIGWAPFGLCGPQIGATPTKQFTVGFLGFGRIAKATLKRLAPFGITKCLYSNTKSASQETSLPQTEEDTKLAASLGVGQIYAVPLKILASDSDLVVVLAPGGSTTYHIVDELFLKSMKPTALLVNTSRGTLVDTDALVKALQEQWIWGAGLDVVEGEPFIEADHPLVKHPRAVVLPHIGSATLDTRTAMATLAARNLISGVLEEPLECEVTM